MSYQLIIFDWQGTLSDSIGQFINEFRTVAKKLGLPQIDIAQLRKLITLDLCTIVQTLFPDESTYKQTQLIELLNDYHLHHIHDVCLYPGVVELLNHLQQERKFLAIATSASQNSISQQLEHIGVTHLFDVVKTPEHTSCKPAPDMLDEIISELAMEKQQAVMIGDSRCDFEAAQNAHIDFIGVNIIDQQLVEDIKAKEQKVVADIEELTSILT